MHRKKSKRSVAICGYPPVPDALNILATVPFGGTQQTLSAYPLPAGPVFHLEAEIKKQADLIANLQSTALANSRAHNDLVQHFQQLRAQVRLNSKSQQLLQELSGVGHSLL